VVDIGTAKRPNYLPAEICEIESGLPYPGKLNESETANMIKHACNPPRVNAESIVHQGLPRLGFTADTRTTPMTGFDVSVDTEMVHIPARELPAPGLSYRSGKPNVKDGSWNILDVKFQRGVVISSWWVMVVLDGAPAFNGPEDPALVNLVMGFADKCKRSGMVFPEGRPRLIATPRLPRIDTDPSRTAALGMIKKALVDTLVKGNKRKPSFILVLLSGRDNYIYPGIKRLGDVELGMHTVHMLLPKISNEEKKADQYFSNVALKLNTKLGGINHTLDAAAMQWLTSKRTMVVGMDVTHPNPKSRPGTPSIAAIVASVDSAFVQYPASLRIQEGRKEVGLFHQWELFGIDNHYFFR
jgi:eukaryotic translation initiation factor 2C